jgi:LCP family protein required for cell wall assembly
MRRLFLVPMLLLLLAAMGMLAVGWRVNSSVSTIQQVSTPAPLVSGDRLGGDKTTSIDTEPARQAVRSYPEQRTSGGGANGVGNTISNLTGGAAIAAGLQEEPSARTMNILLMGVDARPGEAIDIGVRPDALAVLHLDAQTGSCRMLAIPRDSRVELPGYGLSKINHALALGGIPYQEQVVEQFLGITVDHYGLIDFAGIEQVVDAVGGVTIDNPEAFSYSGTTFEAGSQTLDGERALLYARYRGGPDGDFGRVGRQQQVLRAILQSASGRDAISLIPRLLPVVEDHTRTSLGPDEIVNLAANYRTTCTEQTLETETLAGSVATFPDPLLDLDLSYVIVDDAEVRKQVEWLLGG